MSLEKTLSLPDKAPSKAEVEKAVDRTRVIKAFRRHGSPEKAAHELGMTSIEFIRHLRKSLADLKSEEGDRAEAIRVEIDQKYWTIIDGLADGVEDGNPRAIKLTMDAMKDIRKMWGLDIEEAAGGETKLIIYQQQDKLSDVPAAALESSGLTEETVEGEVEDE